MRRLSGDRGAATVELSIVVPILLLAVVGVWTLLWLMHERSQISGLARDAARFASIAHDPFCDQQPCRTGYPTEAEVRAHVLDRADLPADEPIVVEVRRAVADGVAERNERFTVRVSRELPNPFRPLAGLFGLDELVYGSTVIARAE